MKYGVPIQKHIFIGGMAGKKPVVPVNYEQLEQKAKSALSAEAFAYIAGGAGQGNTMISNRKAFADYELKGNMMRASSEIDLGVKLFGKEYSTPLIAAPVGVLELANPQADLAVAKACKTLNIPMIFSNQASYSIEECAEVMDENPRWFQLYWSKSDELVESFIRRAEKSGCEAIVVTLDTTSLGWRPQDLDLGYLPFLHGLGLAQYSSDPIFNKIVDQNLADGIMKSGDKPPINFRTLKNVLGVCRKYPGSFWANLRTQRAMAAVRTFINIYMRPELRWEDLPRLRTMTDLAILVKGVHTAEDAQLAIKHEVDGIIVSNHGGRQIDGAVGALKCLDNINRELGQEIPLIFDSGIRSGADVIKALALGADAVLIGRPYVYGLAVAGEKGVEAVFRHFLAEIELQLSLMGIDSIHTLDRSVLED
ncbi:alpha-hydroxy-acid oxidizing protein [Membranihabitans maritimus]|uniref:alpha-hydroxy-acid oxidizing protein n=1 Tax=Membranihabitans maritimus TaxID=2904244 RepID=UPI001F0129AF